MDGHLKLLTGGHGVGRDGDAAGEDRLQLQ